MKNLKNDKIIPSILFIIIALAAAFFLGQCTKQCPQPAERETVHYDTLFVETQHKSDTFTVVKPRIIFRTDTLRDSTIVIQYRDSAWTASDEVISSKSDTVRSEFFYPEMIFRHTFNYSKDSTKIITVFSEKTIVKERPWWEIPASILGGAAAGYLFGRLK